MPISGTKGALLTHPVLPHPVNMATVPSQWPILCPSPHLRPHPTHTDRPGPCSHSHPSFNIFYLLSLSLPPSPATSCGGASQRPVCSAPRWMVLRGRSKPFSGTLLEQRDLRACLWRLVDMCVLAQRQGSCFVCADGHFSVVATRPLGPITLSLQAAWASKE